MAIMKTLKSILRKVIYFVAIYAVSFVCFIATYDSFSDAGCSIYYTSKKDADLKSVLPNYDKYIKHNWVIFKFKNASVRLSQHEYVSDYVVCSFDKVYDWDSYPYSTFMEMNDSVARFLGAYGYKGYLTTNYGKHIYPATRHNISAWFLKKKIFNWLICKPYLTVLPLAIIMDELVMFIVRRRRKQRQSQMLE